MMSIEEIEPRMLTAYEKFSIAIDRIRLESKKKIRFGTWEYFLWINDHKSFGDCLYGRRESKDETKNQSL